MPQVPLKAEGYSFLKILQYIVLVSFILFFGRTLFIPLSFALLISFILFPVCVWFEKHGFSRSFSIFTTLSLLIILLTGIIFLLIHQLLSFTIELPVIKAKLLEALSDLSILITQKFNITRESQQQWIKEFSNNSTNGLFSFFRSFIYSSSILIVLLVLIPVFSALFLFYRSMLANVLFNLFPIERKPFVQKILHLTVTTYYNFIKGMALVYLIVGILNSIGLLIIGVPHAILFGFIASVLTFIPYVGIVFASIFPIAISWLTYNSIWHPIAVMALYTFVQYLEANIIFPMAVSNRLNINTLATIIMIILGGIIWGAAGMILFVPFIAIVKLIADNTEELKNLSVLLGTKNK